MNNQTASLYLSASVNKLKKKKILRTNSVNQAEKRRKKQNKKVKMYNQSIRKNNRKIMEDDIQSVQRRQKKQ